jgi:hypothetical protein
MNEDSNVDLCSAAVEISRMPERDRVIYVNRKGSPRQVVRRDLPASITQWSSTVHRWTRVLLILLHFAWHVLILSRFAIFPRWFSDSFFVLLAVLPQSFFLLWIFRFTWSSVTWYLSSPTRHLFNCLSYNPLRIVVIRNISHILAHWHLELEPSQFSHLAVNASGV